MLNKLFASKSYFYFDQHAQLQSQELNFLEVFIRKLGFFRHTHLNEVVKIGYQNTLSGRFITKASKEKNLISLFSKSNYEHKLPDYMDDNGSSVKVSVRYMCVKSKIVSIQFKVNQESFSFSRNDDKYLINIPSYDGKPEDTKESITERLNTLESRSISKLVNHIIHDSASTPLACLFRLHATDYRAYLNNPDKNLNYHLGHELWKRDWHYERHVKNTHKISFNPKSIGLNNYKTLSLSFAFNNL